MKIISWIKSHKVEVVFILFILLVGGFLRFYEIADFMHFAGDEARDSFMVRSIARDGDMQLLGPSIAPGDQAFSLGPFFYYLLVPAYWLSGNSPTSGVVMVAIFSFFSIGLLYFITRKWFGVIAAITASFLYAVSWIIIYYGRWIWNPNFVPFFMLAFIISLHYLNKSPLGQRKYWLLGVAVLFSILTQLHGTALYILPPLLLIYFLITRPKINWRYYLLALLIVVLMYSPLIIYDLQNNFSNSRGVIDLLLNRENQGQSIIDNFLQSYAKFFVFYHESLLHERLTPLFIIIFASSLAYIFHLLNLSLRKKEKDIKLILMLLWFFVPFVVFIFYEEFIPPHYFSVVFPLSFIMVGALMSFLIKIKWLRILAIVTPIIFSAILLYNSITILIDLQPEGARSSTYQITFTELTQVRDYVISDSRGENYIFESIPKITYQTSWEYVFDQTGYGFQEGNEENQYIAILGQSWDVKSIIQDKTVLDWKRFGNILVLKIQPTLSNAR